MSEDKKPEYLRRYDSRYSNEHVGIGIDGQGNPVVVPLKESEDNESETDDNP